MFPPFSISTLIVSAGLKEKESFHSLEARFPLERRKLSFHRARHESNVAVFLRQLPFSYVSRSFSARAVPKRHYATRQTAKFATACRIQPQPPTCTILLKLQVLKKKCKNVSPFEGALLCFYVCRISANSRVWTVSARKAPNHQQHPRICLTHFSSSRAMYICSNIP